MLLMKPAEGIAAWFLREHGFEVEQLLQECQKAADSVVKCAQELRSSGR